MDAATSPPVQDSAAVTVMPRSRRSETKRSALVMTVTVLSFSFEKLAIIVIIHQILAICKGFENFFTLSRDSLHSFSFPRIPSRTLSAKMQKKSFPIMIFFVND
jgi:hypothetical protein